MSTLKSSAEDLTLNADGSGNDVKIQRDGTEVLATTSTGVDVTGQLIASNGALLDGSVTINDSGNDRDFRIEDVGGTHAFFLQGSEGRIGINHSTPDARLEIHPENETGLQVQSSVAGETTAIFKGASTSAVDVLRVDNSAEKVFTVEQNGEVTVSIGDIVFGTAGKGIVLGATSNTDANTLDDYEEGTWTPEDSSGTDYTINGTPRYVKAGRMVHIQADINQIPSGSRIYGLPFTSVTGSNIAISIGYSSYSNPVWAHIFSNDAQIALYDVTTYAAVSSNNHRFIIGGTYMTA